MAKWKRGKPGRPPGSKNNKSTRKIIGRASIVTNTEQLLTERGNKYGNWDDCARIARTLKYIIHTEVTLRHERGQQLLTDSQREALEMIAVKISRIIAGKSSFHDHWDDIMGYAKLGKEGHQA